MLSTFMNYGKFILGCFLVLAISLMSVSCGKRDSGVPKAKSNLEKFASIDIDLAAAGVDKEALLEEFLKDPAATRIAVDHHKRKRFMLITAEQEKAISRQFISAMEKENILLHDSEAEARCNSILARLAKVMPEDFVPPYKIYILDTPEINACCLPDGNVVVFRGVLEKFNDDELAWIIAHELGHGIARHSAEMLSKTMVQELAIEGFLDQDSNIFKIAGTYLSAFFINLKYSREQEEEADRLAMLYMNKAGFDMQGAVSVLKQFKRMAGKNSELNELLSTHPHPSSRLKNVRMAIRQLQKDPDHIWGGLADELYEKGKVKAIGLYMKKIRKKRNVEDSLR